MSRMPHELLGPGGEPSLGQQVQDAIRSVSAGYDRYGLLDFPNHGNIGDSAIWVGETTILRRLFGRAPDYVSYIGSPVDEVGRFLPKGIVYLHGGGNLGDIWPSFQNYRERVIERYTTHRIVLLPQSLHYSDPAAIERSKRIFGNHPDFHMMVRDRVSLEFARANFDCNVLLVPDSAFSIDMAMVQRSAAPSGLKCLFRDDKEQRGDALPARALFSDARIEDWHPLGPGYQRAARWSMKVVRRSPGLPAQKALMGLRIRLFDRMADDLVMAGFRQLDAAEVIVTDRLHGHILSQLLGKPHVVIDNFYGKIANFIDAWGPGPDTKVARDYVEARVFADELLAQTRSAKS